MEFWSSQPVLEVRPKPQSGYETTGHKTGQVTFYDVLVTVAVSCGFPAVSLQEILCLTSPPSKVTLSASTRSGSQVGKVPSGFL